MEQADRTIEMTAPTTEELAPPPGGAQSVATPAALPERDLGDRIPSALRAQRPSPALDPIARGRISRAAKWVTLLGILFFVAWIPTYVSVGRGVAFQLAVVVATTIFATVIATALPRIVLARAFGRWHEASEALRDWLIVGLITGALYWGLIVLSGVIGFGAGGAQDTGEWLRYRLPLILIAGTVAVFVARILAIRREGLVGDTPLQAIWQIPLQVILIAVFERLLEGTVRGIVDIPALPSLLGWAAFLCAVASLGIVIWASSADANLSTIKRRRGGTGFDDGVGPVNMTLTVIGGRESGKTVLLAGAFYEWSTQNIGNLRITPATDAGTSYTSINNLEDVARELYVSNQFPVGTVSTSNLPFDLSLGNEKISRFTFLDYPGGAIAGRVADETVIKEFWDRVDDTDGILMIADMSYVRRGAKDADWLEVRNAYRTVMQRLVDRNGKRRVVPVALVLTKCDEFVDPNTGQIDRAAIEAGLKEFQYDELEAEWRRLNASAGPGFAEFSTWITSAITYSQPQTNPQTGQVDLTKPFKIAPPPPQLAPTGCAAPLLWMTAKVLRWNVTVFYDINTFLFGSTPAVRRRVASVLEMERIAEERRGRASGRA